MILKIKRKIKMFFVKIRIFKRLRMTADAVNRLANENYQLKGQLINRRKTIKSLNDEVLKVVNDLNLLGDELDKIKEKKHKAEIIISQLKKRRDEFINRVSAVPDASISNWNDYKFWLSEPFIVDSFKHYVPDKDDIDGTSAIRGLGEVFKSIDEKIDE